MAGVSALKGADMSWLSVQQAAGSMSAELVLWPEAHTWTSTTLPASCHAAYRVMMFSCCSPMCNRTYIANAAGQHRRLPSDQEAVERIERHQVRNMLRTELLR